MGLLAKVLVSCVSTKSEWVDTVSRFLVHDFELPFKAFFVCGHVGVGSGVLCGYSGSGVVAVSMELILISKPCLLLLIRIRDC